ncbi:hypothetical protein [Asticcacaulis sp. AND118]|uniref:hypothetical protein n=1 Tax=Asticcacaulis sp. AND118 TaxID=2840468 RepID=UPI001CFFB46D|nr:hypothetical protein [Asticcacaulis sp. AND118]UDF04215.1 hypothetical protein LH365_04010 [Asticcacaulis sp. AND118]
MGWRSAGCVAAFALLVPVMAQAQMTPRLIEPARIGTVHEALGAARYVAAPKGDCPTAYRTFDNGPCLDTVAARLKAAGVTQARVLGVRHSATGGEAVRGDYGRDYSLYDISLTPAGLRWSEVELATSEIRVPRDCYALRGEEVFYTIENRGGQTVAQERQVVVCGGGPRQPNGPYRVEGPSLPVDPPAVGATVRASGDAWPPTETLRARGEWRYLAQPDPACAPDQLVRKVYCAQTGIAFLQANAGEKELDLIASKFPVRDGDALKADDVEQLVLKRSGKGFKADKRWFERSKLSVPAGCATTEGAVFRVHGREAGLFVAEEALSTCGAPLAPVPRDIFEAYGEARPVAMGRNSCPETARLLPGVCFDEVIAYMRAFDHKALDVVVLKYQVRDGERVWQDYDTAKVRFSDGTYIAERKGPQVLGYVTMSRCDDMSDRPAEGRGYRIEWRGRSLMAVPYEWKACPIY